MMIHRWKVLILDAQRMMMPSSQFDILHLHLIPLLKLLRLEQQGNAHQYSSWKKTLSGSILLVLAVVLVAVVTSLFVEGNRQPGNETKAQPVIDTPQEETDIDIYQTNDILLQTWSSTIPLPKRLESEEEPIKKDIYDNVLLRGAKFDELPGTDSHCGSNSFLHY